MSPTPVHMSYSPYYREVIRAVHILERPDRISIALLYKIPFGSVSRVFSELENDGYIQKLVMFRGGYGRRKFRKSKVWANSDLKGQRLNYGTSTTPASIQYEKTPKWKDFLKSWNEFLSGGDK